MYRRPCAFFAFVQGALRYRYAHSQTHAQR